MRPFGVHHATTKLAFSPVDGGIREPVNEYPKYGRETRYNHISLDSIALLYEFS